MLPLTPEEPELADAIVMLPEVVVVLKPLVRVISPPCAANASPPEMLTRPPLSQSVILELLHVLIMPFDFPAIREMSPPSFIWLSPPVRTRDPPIPLSESPPRR